MTEKITFSIYEGHGDGFAPGDLDKLSSALSKALGQSIIISQSLTPDGQELLFTLEK